MSNLRVQAIASVDLHAWWPLIERGLTDIIKRNNPDWICEDIYASVRTGSAFLAITFIDDFPVCFIIHHPTTTPFSNQRGLFVWIAWTRPLRERNPQHNYREAIDFTMQYVLKLAGDLGVKRITAVSARKGYEKWAAKLGFRKTGSEFEYIIK